MICSICDGDFDLDGGGVIGNFGILPVAFCPTCLSCIFDLVDELEAELEEDQVPWLTKAELSVIEDKI
tara:strand:- start:256 stop:459 length:204 start_codon:yes stop_codon:yes gene_type:complete